MRNKKIDQRNKLIKFLSNKLSYPHSPKTVKHIQTHASDIFIVPPFVYKVKKPVNLRFLDFSSLSKRKYYCEREVELNKRLTNGIYLGVEKISQKNKELSFSDGEIVVEYAVKMKKLPEKYFIKNLLKKNQVNKKDFVKIINKLVSFYKSQPIKKEINTFGKPKIIKLTIDENKELAKKYVNKTVSSACYDAINLYNKLVFKKKLKYFKKRIDLGFIKDCHGDLHLEHINLAPKGLNIFDCIEFNERFRYIDIASDLAFLAMDLDFNGYSKHRDLVISEFSKKTKDQTIYEIIDFYMCYRAYVRGKVESLRSESKEIPDYENDISIKKSKKYFQLALKYSLIGTKPLIIVVFGIVGSGKTTISQLLAEELSFPVISSDIVRKELTGTKLTKRKFVGFNKGLYKYSITKKIYKELLLKGMYEIAKGNNVILDASFSKKRFRDNLLKKSLVKGISLIFIETTAPKNTIRKRLIERENKKSVSDARWDIFEDFKMQYEEPKEINKNMYLKINTNKNKKETIDKIFSKLITTRFKN